MDDSPEPDSFEKRLRFGCGFLFGGIVAMLNVGAFTGPAWAAVLGIAVIIGFLAMRYGDEFWRRI
jgi:hypothetical protein